MELWTVRSDVVEPQEGWPAGLVKCLTCAGQPYRVAPHFVMMLRMNQVSKLLCYMTKRMNDKHL